MDLELFQAASKSFEKREGAQTQLASILGRRWAYLAGPAAPSSFCLSRKIQLSDKYGLILYCEKKLKMSDREIAEYFLKRGAEQ